MHALKPLWRHLASCWAAGKHPYSFCRAILNVHQASLMSSIAELWSSMGLALPSWPASTQLTLPLWLVGFHRADSCLHMAVWLSGCRAGARLHSGG